MAHIRSYLNLTKLVQLIGAGILLFGVFTLWVGPLEIFTYYAFTSGGKFHFAGFEFGSLMFAIITVQVVGYYALALICIPLGYGHLKLHRWARKVTVTLLWDWIALGLPCSIVAFLLLITSKNFSPGSLPILGMIFLLIYPIAPLLMLKFYNSRRVQDLYKTQAPHEGWIDRTPLSILVSGSLIIFFIIVLHIPLLFNGIFPFWGKFTSGMQGVQLIDLSVIILIFLTWGVLNRKLWSWWGSILYLTLLIITSTMTFLTNSPDNILAQMKFAPFEQEIFLKIPIQGYHFAFIFVLPLLISLSILLTFKRYFERN